MQTMNIKEFGPGAASALGDEMPGVPPLDADTHIGLAAAAATSDFGEGLVDIGTSAPDPTPYLSTPQPTMMPGSVLKIPVAIQVVIGSARVPLSQVAQLGPGAMITLDQKLGTPAIILVNGREVARGELFVFDGDGDRLGITITEVNDGRASSAD